MWVQSLGLEDPWEADTATHSSIFAWRIPGTENPAGLQSMGLQRVGHNWTHGAYNKPYDITHLNFFLRGLISDVFSSQIATTKPLKTFKKNQAKAKQQKSKSTKDARKLMEGMDMFSTLIINTCSFFFFICQLHFSQTVKKVKKQNKTKNLLCVSVSLLGIQISCKKL